MTFAPVQLPQVDTSSATADSIGASLGRLGQEVTGTGRLILAGEWNLVFERFVEGVTGLAASFLPNLVSALFVGLVFYGVYRVLLGGVRGVLRRSDRVDRGLEELTVKTLRLVGLGFIAILVFSQLGVNVSALIAGVGIAGLAVGFAAKDSLENFISGVTIMLDRPFRIGDWVSVSGYYGQVTNVTLRSTRLRTLSRETVIFPSVHMVTQAIINHSDGGPLRVEVPFGIAYKEDIDETRAVVMKVVDPEDERLVRDGDHKVVVTGLNDSSVGLMLLVFVKEAGDAVPVRFELIEKVRKALARADIEIPFPHLQMFIDGAEGLRGLYDRRAGNGAGLGAQGAERTGVEAPESIAPEA